MVRGRAKLDSEGVFKDNKASSRTETKPHVSETSMLYAMPTARKKFLPVESFDVSAPKPTVRSVPVIGGSVNASVRPEPPTFCGVFPMYSGINLSDFHVLGEDGSVFECKGRNISKGGTCIAAATFSQLGNMRTQICVA